MTTLLASPLSKSTAAQSFELASHIPPQLALVDHQTAQLNPDDKGTAPKEGVQVEGVPDEGANEATDGQGSDENAGEGKSEVNETDAEIAKPKVDIDDIQPPEIHHDLNNLPFPVRRMRELLLEAAKSGDIEKLRPFIGEGDDMTMLSLTGVDGDPIDYLKSVSGDQQGYELLAILMEVLEAGYVVVDQGTERETYVWPYFFAWPLDKLTPPQKVELYRLITHGDYEDMKDFGAYIFYRTGITPQGRWRFFVAGD